MQSVLTSLISRFQEAVSVKTVSLLLSLWNVKRQQKKQQPLRARHTETPSTVRSLAFVLQDRTATSAIFTRLSDFLSTRLLKKLWVDFGSGVASKRSDFGGDPNHDPDLGIFTGICICCCNSYRRTRINMKILGGGLHPLECFLVLVLLPFICISQH